MQSQAPTSACSARLVRRRNFATLTAQGSSISLRAEPRTAVYASDCMSASMVFLCSAGPKDDHRHDGHASTFAMQLAFSPRIGLQIATGSLKQLS